MYEQWIIHFIGPYGKWLGGREKHGFQNKRIYWKGKEKIKFIRKVSIYCMKASKKYVYVCIFLIVLFCFAFFNLCSNKPTTKNLNIWLVGLVWFMVFNATFNNIPFISWRSVLLVEETGVPGENHWPAASHWQTLSHIEYTSPWTGFVLTPLVVIDNDCTASCKYNYHVILDRQQSKGTACSDRGYGCK